MARRRKYFKWAIPTSVVDIVKSVCADYDRRERAIALTGLDEAVRKRYTELNGIIDIALEDIEQGIRREMLSDIRDNRGYDFSGASPFLAKNTYYLRKRKLIYDVAVGLNLI